MIEYTEAYWKTLQSSIESYIGKESNQLEQTETLRVDENAYTNYRVRLLTHF